MRFTHSGNRKTIVHYENFVKKSHRNRKKNL